MNSMKCFFKGACTKLVLNALKYGHAGYHEIAENLAESVGIVNSLRAFHAALVNRSGITIPEEILKLHGKSVL